MIDVARAAPRVGPWRLLGHALAFLVLWPAFAILQGPAVLATTSLFDGVDPAALRWGMVAGALGMWRELAAAGAALAVTAALAALLAGGRAAPAPSRLRSLGAGLADALGVALALFLGIALELPSALRHPAATALHDLPVWKATALLALLVASLAAGAGWLRASTGRHLAVAAALVAAGFALVRFPPGAPGEARAGVRVVLGLDSLSRRDAGAGLRRLCEGRGGTWYARAVTPGLLTNVVWSGIVTSHRPSELGVFFTFQSPDWRTLPPNLVERARAAGLHTVAFFADQFTMQLGADLPFDEDRSGPRGWRQTVTAALKDAGVFLPALLPHLPHIPGAATPANQEGTYAFSLRRELEDVFTAGREGRGALVLAHLDYLHQPRYPGYSELSPEERARVRAARVAAILDKSVHWQYPRTVGEPLDVYRWKLAHLEETLAETLDETRLLAPARGNALVLFSDHGARTGLRPDAFGDESYFGVPLVTFGLPARDPEAPISLLDIPALVGLPSPVRPGPAEPLVEYVNVTGDEWHELLRTSTALLDGGIRLPERLLAQVGRRMLVYRPYAGTPGYAAAASAPATERPLPPEPALVARLRRAAARN